jgi:hypothetical protein
MKGRLGNAVTAMTLPRETTDTEDLPRAPPAATTAYEHAMMRVESFKRALTRGEILAWKTQAGAN